MQSLGSVFIVGDSYSTFEGYIPDGYNSYYGTDSVLKSVYETWWYNLLNRSKSKLMLNDSFSGSTICNTCRPTLSTDTSFVRRIDKYIENNYFTENEINTIVIFGGTNDSWIESPKGEIIYSDWNEDDLKAVFPAFSYIISRLKIALPNARIITIVNCDINKDLIEKLPVISEHYGADCVVLSGIDKIGGHPTALGMKQISDQIFNQLCR